MSDSKQNVSIHIHIHVPLGASICDLVEPTICRLPESTIKNKYGIVSTIPATGDIAQVDSELKLTAKATFSSATIEVWAKVYPVMQGVPLSIPDSPTTTGDASFQKGVGSGNPQTVFDWAGAQRLSGLLHNQQGTAQDKLVIWSRDSSTPNCQWNVNGISFYAKSPPGP